ncbi:MAG: hypothetical protein ABIV36_22615 [Sphingobium limneticum]
MSVIASALKHMLAAGMPADAIVAAVAAMEAEIAAAPRQRTAGAIRTARWRESKASLSSQSVTCDDSDASVTLTPSLDKETSPRPPKEINLNPEGDASPCEADPIGFPVPLKIAVAVATCLAIQRIKPPFVLPAEIPAQPWADFVAMRQRIRKPMTDRAKQLAVLELDKLAAAGWPPGDVLNNSTMNSYQGLVPPKGRNNGQHRQDRTANDIHDPLARTVLARQAGRASRSQDEPF